MKGYKNPSMLVWKDMKMGISTKHMREGKWLGRSSDALGLKMFEKGTKIRKVI